MRDTVARLNWPLPMIVPTGIAPNVTVSIDDGGAVFGSAILGPISYTVSVEKNRHERRADAAKARRRRG